MAWIIGGAAIGLLCYTLGFIIGYFRAQEKFKEARGEMELDDEETILPKECYNCKDIGLPCDPNCKHNVMNSGEELKVKDVKLEENNSEKS